MIDEGVVAVAVEPLMLPPSGSAKAGTNIADAAGER